MSSADTSVQVHPLRSDKFEQRLKARYAKERRFKFWGLASIIFSVAVLALLLGNMTLNGIGGFQRVEATVEVDFAQSNLQIPAGQSTAAKVLLGVFGVSYISCVASNNERRATTACRYYTVKYNCSGNGLCIGQNWTGEEFCFFKRFWCFRL